jgi:hypothetical protein
MATKQEKEIAKQKAVKGGMPSDVADNVFRMQMGKDKSGIDSGHAFPMKQAYTIRMSPMLQTKDEEGQPQDIESKTIAMPSGALATQTDVTSSFEIPGTPGTAGTDLPSYEEAWEQDIEGIRTGKGYGGKFENYLADMTGIQPGDARDIEREAARAKAAKGTPGTPPSTGTKTETTIDPKTTQTKGLTALSQRKDARAGLVLARNIGKMEKKIARAKRKDDRKGTTSARTTALERELQNLKNKSKARGEQSDQGFAGTQTYNIDVIGTPEQRKQLAASGKSTYDTSNLLAMPGSGKKSNEFGRFGYQAGSMLENIAMPMMKFKGKKSTYKK